MAIVVQVNDVALGPLVILNILSAKAVLISRLCCIGKFFTLFTIYHMKFYLILYDKLDR